MVKKAGRAAVKVRFDHRFYPWNCVEKAMKSYASFADLTSSRKDGFVDVRIANIDKAYADTLVDEFCNYVLSLT